MPPDMAAGTKESIKYSTLAQIVSMAKEAGLLDSTEEKGEDGECPTQKTCICV